MLKMWMTIHQYSNGPLTVPKSPKRTTEIYRNVSYRSFHFAIFCASVPYFLSQCCCCLLLVALRLPQHQALSIKCLANNHRTITHINIPTEWRFVEKLRQFIFIFPISFQSILDFVIVLWIVCDAWFLYFCFSICAKLLIHFFYWIFFPFFVSLRDLYPRLITACSLKSAQFFQRTENPCTFILPRISQRFIYFLVATVTYIVVDSWLSEDIWTKILTFDIKPTAPELRDIHLFALSRNPM